VPRQRQIRTRGARLRPFHVLHRRPRQSQIGVGLDRDKARALIAKAANQIDQPAIVRVTMFDPDLNLGHPAAVLDPHMLITARPAPPGGLGPVSLGVARYRRDLPQIKHTGLMRTIALRRWAQGEGYDDVVFCDEHERLSEGATWNVAFIDHTGGLVLPDQPCLQGVTLRLLLREVGAAGIPCRRRSVTVAEVRTYPAGMITNAAIGLRPISSLADAEMNPGHPMLAKLRSQYERVRADVIQR
jgi:branched-subunit amino acid aminotransferase/4-amino-4-deoxychorismate lyase